MPAPITVRMFNEHGCPWPFFGPESLMSPEEFPLPAELTEQVLAWTSDFARHYDEERGWPSAQAYEASRQEGRRLAAEVQTAVGDEVRIQLEHWERMVDGQEASAQTS